MTERSVIIIGAGLAGLSTGCYAQMNGYRSRIFEHHSVAGGLAAAWRRKEYLIDGGIHFLMGNAPGTDLYRMYEQLGIAPSVTVLDLRTYGRFTDEASGRSTTITSNLDRLASDLRPKSMQDARAVAGLIASARAMQGLSMGEMGMGNPPELSGPLGQLRDMWRMRRLLRYVTGKFGRPIRDYARELDPYLQILLENLFLPEVPVYFVAMLLAMLADGDLGLIEGGCRDFVGAMENRYAELGGQSTYRATVEEVLVQGGRAVGIRLADGTEHRADVVVSAADGHSTIFGLLGGRYTDEGIRRRYTTWELVRPLTMISFGVAREFPGEPVFSTVRLEKPIQAGSETIDGFMVRLFNYSSKFAPPGKSIVQIEFETQFDDWHDLQAKDRAGYEARKAEAAAQVLDRLEAHYPGIASQVEMVDVVTPYTTWRYTLNRGASYLGWLMTPETLRTALKRTLPGLNGFYMAGQWVVPGGGVPACLYSGRDAVQLICRDDGQEFVTSSHS